MYCSSGYHHEFGIFVILYGARKLSKIMIIAMFIFSCAARDISNPLRTSQTEADRTITSPLPSKRVISAQRYRKGSLPEARRAERTQARRENGLHDFADERVLIW